MPDSREREALIGRINGMQTDLARMFAHDRSVPFLASTLTMQQLKVVVILSLDGSSSGQELATKLGVGVGTVTGIVDRLVAQDIVERHEDPTDRRVRRVALSPAGQRLSDELNDLGMAKFRQILEQLDSTTLRDFERVMQKIREVINRIHDAQV